MTHVANDGRLLRAVLSSFPTIHIFDSGNQRVKCAPGSWWQCSDPV